MKLNKIKKPSLLFRIPQDIRHHTFGLSRLIYIALLIIFCLIFLNYTFYHVYLLRGDAFVDAEKEMVGFEYNTQINSVLVENGQRVHKGQALLLYDSNEFRKTLLQVISDYSQVVDKRQSLSLTISKLEAAIAAAKPYVESQKQAKETLEKLSKNGNASIDRLMTEKNRYYTVYKDLLNFQTELEMSKKTYEELGQVFKVSSETLTHLVETFQDGVKYSPVEGVIAELTVQTGDIVRPSQQLARIYYGQRYLTTLFEPSYVAYKEGDLVIVSFSKGSLKIGQIVELGQHSLELPDEIKPRYRPPGRRTVARILVEKEELDKQEILTIAQVYKPVGLETFCRFFKCPTHLIEEYHMYLKQKEEVRSTQTHTHKEKNDYLEKVKNSIRR